MNLGRPLAWMALPLVITASAFSNDNENKKGDALPDLATVPEVGSPGGPRRAMVPEERTRWLAGRRLFARAFSAREGLGPTFNAVSCGKCHVDPALGGAGGIEVNVRVGKGKISERYERFMRDPVNVEAVRGARSTEEIERLLTDARVLFERGVEDASEHDLLDLVDGTIQTPSVLGMGLIESIHEDEILGRADPDDRDHNGVRGTASRVAVGSTTQVGRFGWQAQMPTMNDFVRAACAGELGLTVPDEVGFGNANDEDAALDPGIDLGQARRPGLLLPRAGGPRARRRGRDGGGQAGRRRSSPGIGCADCHVPAMQGSHGPVNARTPTSSCTRSCRSPEGKEIAALPHAAPVGHLENRTVPARRSRPNDRGSHHGTPRRSRTNA